MRRYSGAGRTMDRLGSRALNDEPLAGLTLHGGGAEPSAGTTVFLRCV
jgi:hypothetical protein